MLSKQYKTLDKEISKANTIKEQNCEDGVIDIKINNTDEIMSKYNYENQATLSEEFSEYLWKNAKLLPLNKEITIKIHSKDKVDENLVQNAVKNHYKEEYMETKASLRKINLFSLMTLLAGVLGMVVLYFLYKFVNIQIVNLIVEIVVWVFVWESADSFFLRRTSERRKALTIQKLYSAKIEIIKK